MWQVSCPIPRGKKYMYITIDCLTLLSVSIDLLVLTGFMTTMLCFCESVLYFPWSNKSVVHRPFPWDLNASRKQPRVEKWAKYLWTTKTGITISPLSRHLHKMERPLELSAHNSSQFICVIFLTRGVRSSKFVGRLGRIGCRRLEHWQSWKWHPID